MGSVETDCRSCMKIADASHFKDSTECLIGVHALNRALNPSSQILVGGIQQERAL